MSTLPDDDDLEDLRNTDRALFTKWNKRLKAEGLGVLDRPVYDDNGLPLPGCSTVNNKGSGKITTSARGLNRSVAFAEICNREAVYWNTKFRTTRERAIFKRWAQGYSTTDIAQDLGITDRQTVRTIIKRVKKRIQAESLSLKATLLQCDRDFINEVLDAIDITNPQESDLPPHLQALLETPLSAYEDQMITTTEDD